MTTIQYEVWSYLKADIGGGPGGSVTFSKSLNQYGVGLSRAKAVGSIVVLFRDVRIAVMKWIILPASETKEKRADEHPMLGDKDFTAPWHPARLCKAPPCPDGKKIRGHHGASSVRSCSLVGRLPSCELVFPPSTIRRSGSL